MQIDLEEFLKYMDILLNGGQDEKTELTFYMIDVERKGWFSFDEFSELIFSILVAWNQITANQISKPANISAECDCTVFHRNFG